jgi:hypothetical protein
MRVGAKVCKKCRDRNERDTGKLREWFAGCCLLLSSSVSVVEESSAVSIRISHLK